MNEEIESNVQEEVVKEQVNEEANNSFDKEAFKKELFKEWQEQLDKAKQEENQIKTMKPDEKLKYELDKMKKANEDKALQLEKRELRLDAHNILVNKKLDCRILDILDYTSKENCIKSIDTIEAILKDALEVAVNDRLKGTTPKQGISNTSSLEEEIRKGLGVK